MQSAACSPGGIFMLAINDEKYVYAHNGRDKWEWMKVRVKFISPRSQKCLVDFLDGSGSALFEADELFDYPRG